MTPSLERNPHATRRSSTSVPLTRTEADSHKGLIGHPRLGAMVAGDVL